MERKIKEIREAVAEYMFSEGCSCCRGSNHGVNKRRLAKLLGVSKYSDGSGYDFSPFRKDAKREVNGTF